MIMIYFLVVSISSIPLFSSENKKAEYFAQWSSPYGVTTFHKLKKAEDFRDVTVKWSKRCADSATFSLVYRLFLGDKKMRYSLPPKYCKMIAEKFFFDSLLKQRHIVSLCVSCEK